MVRPRVSGTQSKVSEAVSGRRGPCPRPLANRRLADFLEVGEEVCGVWGNQHPSNLPAGTGTA
jgi:hypothetical protein